MKEANGAAAPKPVPNAVTGETIDKALARIADEARTVKEDGATYWTKGCAVTLEPARDGTATAWGKSRPAPDDLLEIAKRLGLVPPSAVRLGAGDGESLSGGEMHKVRKAAGDLRELREREREWAERVAERLWRRGIMARVDDDDAQVTVSCYVPVRHSLEPGGKRFDPALSAATVRLFSALCLDAESRRPAEDEEDLAAGRSYNHGTSGHWLRDARRYAPSDMLPNPGESAASYFDRVSIGFGELKRRAAAWVASGRNEDRYAQALGRARRGPDAPGPMLLGGLIPGNAVTMLVGERKTGKSTLMQQFALSVARGDAAFLGAPIAQAACAGRYVVVLAGEDTAEVVLARLIRMNGGADLPSDLVVIPRDGRGLADVLEDIAPLGACLLIVDPAREYMDGNEDSSDTASTFMSVLRRFAEDKGCAVVVTHHPGKLRRSFRSVSEVATSARGSSVLLDRARVVMGMVRKTGLTYFGIARSADGERLLTNLPADQVRADELRLTFDPETECSAMYDADRRGGPSGTPSAGVGQLAPRVLDVVARIRAAGGTVTKTGRSGVYEVKAPELAVWSRHAIRGEVDRLLAAGALVDGPDGLAVAEQTAKAA